MLKKIIISTLFLLMYAKSFASHIVGGEIYYDYLGNNQYQFYIIVYRDCFSTGAAFDDPLSLGVFATTSNAMVQNVNIPFPGSVTLPIIFDNPCVVTPPNICTERAIYTTVLTLPPIPGGYTVAYQRCCRGPNVTNLINPDDTGLTWETHVPGPTNNEFINSSPRFTNYPPLALCNNVDLNFDHSATDPDGDSLSYALVTPNSGASPANPMPQPPPSPPYGLVTWAAGINAAQPLAGGSITTINPVTGHLFVDANFLGLFVVGIRVYEWRNGAIINETTRDFLFRVVNCEVQLEAIVNEQETTPGFVSYCNGLSFTFDNLSWGGNSYQWNFGDPTTTADVSTSFEPTYTYPAPGTYTATLIVNPGSPCTDTTTVELLLDNPFDVNFNFTDLQCENDNSFDFTSFGTGLAGSSYTWNLGTNASVQTATTPNVNDVVFSNTLTHSVFLKAERGFCKDSITKIVTLLPAPTSVIEFEPNQGCQGLTQTFQNGSVNAASYSWDFGVIPLTSDTSNVAEPTYIYPGPGNYTITLIATTAQGCKDTIQEEIAVIEPLTVSVSHPDSLCITDNSFDFVGTVTGPPGTQLLWNFGSFASPSTATTVNVNDVVFSQPGTHPISLSVSFSTCIETANSQVFLFKEPTIYFSALDTVGCEPFAVKFVNGSTSDSPPIYTWSFGDGSNSSATSPTHVYQNAGQYSVNLQMITTEGCIDTLNQFRFSYITVNPTPTAGFSVDRVKVDICDAEVNFKDESFGGNQYMYLFDDGDTATSSSFQNPSYTYMYGGTHYPIQIVTNEFFCSDTARLQIIVEPMVVFVPNTFTPDGNIFNNVFEAKMAFPPIEWEMTIYNRWGEELWKTNDYEDYWDGTYQGKMMQDGIYTYKIKYVPCGILDDEILITGHVNLLR